MINCYEFKISHHDVSGRSLSNVAEVADVVTASLSGEGDDEP